MKHIPFLVILAFLLACKSDTPQRPDSSVDSREERHMVDNEAIKEKLRLKKEKPLDPDYVTKLRSQAISILNHRLKTIGKTYAMVEAGTFEYQFVYNGEMSKPGAYKGKWIDFRSDHTYGYGDKTGQKGTGKYNYHLDRSEILMVDDDPSKKPEEWQTKHADDVMIMIGTATYKDNHIQMKLVKVGDDIQKR